MTDREFCEWVRLHADATADGAVHQRLIDATNRLIAATDRLDVFNYAVEHVTAPQDTRRSFGTEGWVMIGGDRYTDLLVAEERADEALAAATRRIDRSGRDVTDLPGLWSEEDRTVTAQEAKRDVADPYGHDYVDGLHRDGCRACAIEFLMEERDEAREAARWIYEHRDEPALIHDDGTRVETRWPWLTD